MVVGVVCVVVCVCVVVVAAVTVVAAAMVAVVVTAVIGCWDLPPCNAATACIGAECAVHYCHAHAYCHLTIAMRKESSQAADNVVIVPCYVHVRARGGRGGAHFDERTDLHWAVLVIESRQMPVIAY